MAGTSVAQRQENPDGSIPERIRLQLNNAIDDLEVARRILNVNRTTVGNVGGGEDDLMTYALAANKLATALSGVRVKAWGKSANNATAKTLKAYFGSQVVHSVALTASQAGRWSAEFIVLKTGASTQDWASEIWESVATLAAGKGAVDDGTATQTDTATITIKFTGTAGADNDITQDGMLVEFLPVAADLVAAKTTTFDG